MKGIKTVILEAGARVEMEDFVNDEWESFAQLAWTDMRTTSGSWRVAKDFSNLPAWIVKAVGGSTVHWAGAWLAALVAVASHLLLDFTNVYGIRLLLPFSKEWLRLDLSGLFDPWIWGVLLLGLAVPFLSRLVSAEISSGKARVLNYGRGSARFALLLVSLYDGGRAVLHARAVATLESRLYQGETPARVLAVGKIAATAKPAPMERAETLEPRQ